MARSRRLRRRLCHRSRKVGRRNRCAIPQSRTSRRRYVDADGVEGHYHKVSTVLLGFKAADSSKLTGWGELKQNFPDPRTEPVAIAALPANLDSVERAIADTLPRFAGIELVDAAPRGLGQLDLQQRRIRQIARSHHLILVASSNNHGWGQTAAAWNLVRIPRWRSMPPDSVGALLENVFRARDSSAVTIIERDRPGLSGVSAAFILPMTVFHIIGSLTPFERVSWVIWVWTVFVVCFALFASDNKASHGAGPGADRLIPAAGIK
jgi:hypothetical protein